MQEKKFDLEEFKQSIGLTNDTSRYEGYNYEAYRLVNPDLTEEVYRQLWQMKALWKVVCGKEVVTHWGMVMLKPVWYLDTDKNNARRFLHGYDNFKW